MAGKVYSLAFLVDGQVRTMTLPAAVSVSGADSYLAACMAGLGLVQMPRYRIGQELAEGRLQAVLTQWPPAPLPVSVLYPHNRQLSPRVRVFADWLTELFAAADTA